MHLRLHVNMCLEQSGERKEDKGCAEARLLVRCSKEKGKDVLQFKVVTSSCAEKACSDVWVLQLLSIAWSSDILMSKYHVILYQC